MRKLKYQRTFLHSLLSIFSIIVDIFLLRLFKREFLLHYVSYYAVFLLNFEQFPFMCDSDSTSSSEIRFCLRKFIGQNLMKFIQKFDWNYWLIPWYILRLLYCTVLINKSPKLHDKFEYSFEFHILHKTMPKEKLSMQNSPSSPPTHSFIKQHNSIL